MTPSETQALLERLKQRESNLSAHGENPELKADLSAAIGLIEGLLPRPIAEMDALDDDTLVFAWRGDGKTMTWRVSLLRNSMQERTPSHLRFPATHFILLSALEALHGETE